MTRAQGFAHIRTSSAANVGTDKDSDKRQRAAIESFAKSPGVLLTAMRTVHGAHYER